MFKHINILYNMLCIHEHYMQIENERNLMR